ncbi:bifunctional 4-hydroxy-2-oxoglutarate aldolase/2-dehydro-3-deoxy-phosphogluconate aldolase [Compostibacter hankyongensis]|uniref:Bifunctional 4-hydroxy-2-oxoglutarate aldolase/2-dehydro-3-deoxy-phosphogluconate aldolase n=1 Tax=Compostibacter hankyongensis TaxID=1007089 RepID=A0ABP8FUK4_9BACT
MPGERDPKIVLQKILDTGIVPVFYHDDPEVCKSVLKACYEGGIRVFELTHQGFRTQENYILLKKYAQRQLPDLYLGVGAVWNTETAATFINYQADFIVAPLTMPETGALCREKNMLWIPGCMTPTEIGLAEKAGAALVKLFPGELLGPEFVQLVRPLFPNLKFMPAGGVEATTVSLTHWLEAGASAVGMSGSLISPDLVAAKKYALLKEKAQLVRKIIDRYRAV